METQITQDKVPHQRLLLKLRDHSIGDNVVNWISSWPQATKSMHQWGTVNLEASMEWSPAWICSRSGTLPYLHQRDRPWNCQLDIKIR